MQSPPRARTRRKTRRIAIVAVDPVEELDVTGPMSVFAHANRCIGQRAAAGGGTSYSGLLYEVVLIGTECTGFVRGESGLSLATSFDYNNAPDDIDTLLIAGGNGAIRSRDTALIRWIVERARSAERVGSICTGAFVLAATGLLNGRRATTHWLEAGNLAARFPEISVDPDPIWIRDGKFYTSAGITAGIDLALALVEGDHGAKLALDVARRLVMFVRRPGGQAQFSVFLAADAVETPALRELQNWLPQHLTSTLSIGKLARRCAMSERTFARAFVREFGITPARYTERLRVEAARNYMETTRRSLASVARMSGFGNGEGMRRAFIRILGVTPREYQSRFIQHRTH